MMKQKMNSRISILPYCLLCLLIFSSASQLQAQLYFRATLQDNQDKTYRNLVQNTIQKNLKSDPDSTNEWGWMSAFTAMEVLQYKSPWVDARIADAANDLQFRSTDFQRAFLELIFTNYPNQFYEPAKLLLMQTQHPKVFAMCANYILHSDRRLEDINFLQVKTAQLISQFPGQPILTMLQYHLQEIEKPNPVPDLTALFSKSFLPGRNIIFSFQRKNRDYPGIVMVRDSRGNFVKDSSGTYFNVPQLARAITNLPSYLTNGNTPQGIYKMSGYDVSRAIFIGPTVNVQLRMPYETKAGDFYFKPSMPDSLFTLADYKNLLPPSLRGYLPLFESYYAGKAGRSEIIIHGSTLNADYYAEKIYYPLVPTMGCLTSYEQWDPKTGQRSESDQQKLINALIPIGGATGYAVVININDIEAPVQLADILPFLAQ